MLGRNDVAFIGFGHGGNKLVDTLIEVDQRYIGYFINSSKLDIQSLKNYDDVIKNYYTIPQADGTGRNRNLGKRYASKNGFNIIDIIQGFDQKVLFFAFSLGGGSGSSIASVMLNAIENMKKDEDNDFDKIINIIAILPKLDSSTKILENTIETWNEIMNYSCINNMYFIDNNNLINGEYLEEEEINYEFASLIDSMFELPTAHNENVFDSSDLSRLITSKGCSYIYKLPSGCNSTEEACKLADENSILAKMYKTEDNTYYDKDEEKNKIVCEYVGTSFNDENYHHEDIMGLFKPTNDNFSSYNIEENLVLISGCLPPLYSIQVIEAELHDRKNGNIPKIDNDYSKMAIKANINKSNDRIASKNHTTIAQKKEMDNDDVAKMYKTKSKSIKQAMKKKNLFDIL